jgi:hypothetical protein
MSGYPEPVDVSSATEGLYVKRVPGRTAAPRIITSNAFHDALVAAGVIRAEDGYRKIVIVAEAHDAVMIYAERFGDERLLGVAMTLDGIEVRYGEPARTAPVPPRRSCCNTAPGTSHLRGCEVAESAWRKGVPSP